jgi:DNA-directed DNA polymerase III PolC
MLSPVQLQNGFVPIHAKSDYSLGYGTASIEELVPRAEALGYRSLALTDLENLYGQVRFHDRCRLHGIHPVTGIELRPGFQGRSAPGARAGRIVLLARNRDGYRSLCRIVSIRRGGVNGETAPADPLPLVEQNPAGLFALSDDLRVVERLAASGKFLPETIGLLVVRPDQAPAGDPQKLREVATRLGVRLVADLDALFLDPADHPLHVLQLAVAQNRLMAQVERGPDVEVSERWLRAPEEVAALFADMPEALLATREIADACRLDLGGTEATAHVFNREAAESDSQRLRGLCLEAQAAHSDTGERWSDEHSRRLERELSVLDSLGFSGFMLIVAEILSHCRHEGILVAVRGSAVSSLVLHLLGGSPVDPISQGLIFERFLHEGKTAWPDVDIDLPWDRRDEVIDWVYQRFGPDKVAMLAAHHTFRYRSALREGLKAWGAPASLIESLSRSIPPDDFAVEEVDFLGIAASVIEADGATPQEHSPENPQLHKILQLIARLVGRPRHLAVHPGGIVIDWRPLGELVPLELAPKGVVITQYDLVAVAKLGLVKIDLLGNRCLSEIAETLTLAGWQRPLRLDAIPPEDQVTLSLIDRAGTIGCFQLESPAMRSLLARLPIRRQSDLVAALALIRPGASAGEVKTKFIRRARGEERRDIAFPVLSDRLSETHGLPIYEEEIMVLLSRCGGVTLAQADELRRGIVKSGGDTILLRSLQRTFLNSAREKYGNDAHALARAGKAWLLAARFAAYSFNKAHAASYALLSYYSAYLKAHHPVEFACALLNHHQGLYPLRVEAAELKRMGVKLLAPHVNFSGTQSRLEEGEGGNRSVRVGLDKVKGLSQRAADAIVALRRSRGAFETLPEVLEQAPLRINEVTALVLSGGCDNLAPLDAGKYPFIHEAVLELLRQNRKPSELEALKELHATAPPGEEARMQLYQSLERVRNELKYLEMHISHHPMELLRAEAKRYRCLPIAEAVSKGEGRPVRLAAVMAAMRRVQTRQGALQFLTLDDETGVLEAVVFPAVYQRLGERVTTPGPFLVEGRLRFQQGAVHLEVSRLEPFHKRRELSQ